MSVAFNPRPHSTATPAGMNLLELRGVTVSFDGFLALNDLNEAQVLVIVNKVGDMAAAALNNINLLLNADNRAALRETVDSLHELSTGLNQRLATLDRTLEELTFVLNNPEQQKDRGEVLDALFLMGAAVAETPGMSRENLEKGKGAAGPRPAPAQTPPQQAPGAAPSANMAAAAGGNPDQLYNDGFKMFQDGDYAGAEKNFKAFVQRYPQHTLAANAQYWLAESYSARGDFQNAAIAFAAYYCVHFLHFLYHVHLAHGTGEIFPAMFLGDIF